MNRQLVLTAVQLRLLEIPFIFNVRQSYCARYCYRLDVCLSVRLSVRHTLVLCRNGSTYRQNIFTAW